MSRSARMPGFCLLLGGLLCVPACTHKLHIVSAPDSPAVEARVSDPIVLGLADASESDEVTPYIGKITAAMRSG